MTDFFFPFGKHEGKRLKDMPTGYLEWCLKNFDDKKDYIKQEIVQFMTGNNKKPAKLYRMIIDERGAIKKHYREEE